MKSLMIAAGSVLRHTDNEHCAVSARLPVDHRRGGDADLGSDLGAPVISAGGFVRAKDRSVPDRCSAVRIECVNAVVFRDRVNDIAQLTAGGEVGEIEWLPVHLSIDGQDPEQAELR